MPNINAAQISSIRLEEQTVNPDSPAAGYYQVFSKSDGLYIKSSAGVVTGPFAPREGGVTFNDAGADVDFRVESDANTHALFLDASANALGVNTSAPTAQLHIGAGTAAAGTAPIKLTLGTLLTVPEAGVIEFDGTGIYHTAVNHRRFVSVASDSIIATVTATNHVAPTTLWTGVLNANELKAQRVYLITACGLYTTHDAADQATIILTVGGTTVLTINTPAGLVTNMPWDMAIWFTIRTVGAAGTVSTFGRIQTGTTIVHMCYESIAIDTTVINNMILTAQWSDASNSLKLTQCWIAEAD